jgi:hypothetical protein
VNRQSAHSQSNTQTPPAAAERQPLRLDDVLLAGRDDSPHGAPAARPAPAAAGALIGVLAAVDRDGRPLVEFPGMPHAGPLPARSTVALGSQDAGAEAVLVFEGGDQRKPIVLGVLKPEPAGARQNEPRPAEGEAEAAGAEQLDAQIDGRRVVLTAEREIVLRCGKASITLTRAGKILIRGAYLLSRSSGVNKIKGGSVQIN